MLKESALLSPIFISLFWGLIFFIQTEKKENHKTLLGIFMLFAFLLYCSHAIFFSELHQLYSFIEGIYIFSMLALYPIYYNYLLLLTTGKYCPKKFVHFIPAVFFGVCAFIMTLILSPEERIYYVEETLLSKNLKGLSFKSLVGIKGIIFFLSRGFFILQVGVYGIKGIQLANNHNEKIEEYYSNTEGKTLNWVRILSIFIIIAAVASITFAFIGRSYFSVNEVSLLIPSVIFSTFLFIVGFKGNQQIQISSEFETEEIIIDFNEQKNEQNENLKDQLIELFEKNKIYKNVDLRIVSISEILKTNRTYISKLINEEFEMNFNGFVNTYRIEEAKLLLASKDRKIYTMEYIAEKSGFGSINSFLRVFKSMEGITPSQFKKEIQL